MYRPSVWIRERRFALFRFRPEDIIFDGERANAHFLRARNEIPEYRYTELRHTFAEYIHDLLFTSKWRVSSDIIKIEEFGFASVFPMPFRRNDYTVRNAERGAIKSESNIYRWNRTIRLMKIPIVTPQVLRWEIFRRVAFGCRHFVLFSLREKVPVLANNWFRWTIIYIYIYIGKTRLISWY